MTVQDSLDKLYGLAKQDSVLRQRLLDTRNEKRRISAFCRIAAQEDCPMDPMELIAVGEENYAAMRRSTNGGGENSPLLAGEDDIYEMFLISLEYMRRDHGV